MSKIYWEITDILEIQLIKKRQYSYMHVVFVDIMIVAFLIFCPPSAVFVAPVLS